jgi:hypothetical protein
LGPKVDRFESSNPELFPLLSPNCFCLHAICARVAHLSGAAELIDQALGNFDEGSERVLSSNGISTQTFSLLLERQTHAYYYTIKGNQSSSMKSVRPGDTCPQTAKDASKSRILWLGVSHAVMIQLFLLLLFFQYTSNLYLSLFLTYCAQQMLSKTCTSICISATCVT